MNKQLTVLIPTSPIPSHPSTEILDETIANIRKRDMRCSIKDCEKPVRTIISGLCDSHHRRQRLYGDPCKLIKIQGDNETRFFNKIIVTENECWVWQGTIGWGGYSVFTVANKNMSGHRWSYLHFKGGPIPTDLEVDHICNNPACVNPDHLQLLTPKQNMERASHVLTNRTHCRKGHLLSEVGIMIDSKGYNACKACDTIRRENRNKRAVQFRKDNPELAKLRDKKKWQQRKLNKKRNEK